MRRQDIADQIESIISQLGTGVTEITSKSVDGVSVSMSRMDAEKRLSMLSRILNEIDGDTMVIKGIDISRNIW